MSSRSTRWSLDRHTRGKLLVLSAYASAESGEPRMARPSWNAQFTALSVDGFANLDIQHAIAMTNFGLMAAQNYRPAALVAPQSWFQVETAKVVNPTSSNFSDLCRTWALRAGVREMCEAVSTVALRLNGFALYAIRHDAPPPNEEVVAAEMGVDDKFERPGLAGRLRLLRERYQINLEPAMERHCETINQARNCLVHRSGVVGSADTNDGARFTLRWRALDVKLAMTGQLRQPTAEHESRNDGAITAGLAERTRSFEVGSRLDLTEQEFAEIAFTLQLVALALCEQFRRFLERKGIPVAGPSTTTE